MKFSTKFNFIRGFTLIEILVTLVVFAAMAALAWGGLNSIVRTRGELMQAQESFQALARTIDTIDRDLRQAVARPVLGNHGEALPSLIGAPDRIELTRIGFANPQAELRSNLERVAYAFDANQIVRANYAVLDRAPTTQPAIHVLRTGISLLRLRYLDAQGRWVDAWPESEPPNNAPVYALPRAVEVHITTPDYGEITRLVELVSDWPDHIPGGMQ